MPYYVDMIMKLRCAPDLLARRLFPNAKEWEESFGMFQAVKSVVGTKELGRRDITLVSVGDGHTPRTAALFAHMSAWQCISIDPQLRQKEYKISRLQTFRSKVEDLKLHYGGHHLIIVGVHAHISLQKTLNSILPANFTRRSLFFMPCCVKSDLPVPPDKVIVDRHIRSPHNEIQVWNAV